MTQTVEAHTARGRKSGWETGEELGGDSLGRKRRKGPRCLNLAPVRTLFTVASAALLHQPSSSIAITLEGGGGQGCKGCCNCRSGNMVSCIPYIQMQISVENGNSPRSKNRGSFYHAEVIVCPSCPGLVIVENMSLEMAQ